MTDVEQRIVRAILLAAKVRREDLDWMVAACPSVARAREIYGRTHVPGSIAALRPEGWYEGVNTARAKLLLLERDSDAWHVAKAELVTEIGLLQERARAEDDARNARRR